MKLFTDELSLPRKILVNFFGELPKFNFALDLNITPTSPKGRPSFNTDDEDENVVKTRKRKTRSPNNSPNLRSSKPKVNDTSYDDPNMDDDAEADTNDKVADTDKTSDAGNQ